MQRISNPVLPGFHPDPSFLRVGKDYYIATSTFEWFPGVEIHHSYDLVTWTKVNSPLSEKRLLDMDGALASCGVWAPCLSWSDGLFYLIYTNVRSWNTGPWKDTPNYLTTAPNIEGPWSDPIYLNSSGFDPSLFHDDDGKKWLVNMEWDWRKIDGEQFSGILLQEYSPKDKKLIGPISKIYPGTEIAFVEAPHLYKKNGWYYIFAAEGGTGYEHAETVGRSKNIAGPYEFHPHNPLISSYGHPELTLQKSGHASFCDTPDGRSYLAFLCGRPLPGTINCVLGRETSIVELEWIDDWPYLKPEEGVDLFTNGIVKNWPSESFEPPLIHAEKMVTTSLSEEDVFVYTFDGNSIHKDFKSLRVQPEKGQYSIDTKPGFLSMRGGQSPISLYGQSLLARRQTDFSFTAETKISFEPKKFQHLAGLSWRYNEANQYLCAITFDEQLGRVLKILTVIDRTFTHYPPIPLSANEFVWLGLDVNVHTGQFKYSYDGKKWNVLRPVLQAAVLSDEHGGLGFTGAFVGMFNVDTENYTNMAHFESFTYRNIVTKS